MPWERFRSGTRRQKLRGLTRRVRMKAGRKVSMEALAWPCSIQISGISRFANLAPSGSRYTKLPLRIESIGGKLTGPCTAEVPALLTTPRMGDGEGQGP